MAAPVRTVLRNAKSTHNNKAPTATEPPAPDDALSVLPVEILEMILGTVGDTKIYIDGWSCSQKLRSHMRYKGQQRKFSTRLDPDAVPPCVDYGIILRYLEEVLKNLKNLEIVETTELTESMSHSLLAQRNLKALRLYPKSELEDEATTSLVKIKNLQHLSIVDNWGYLIASSESIVQSMLLNSMSTIQSLDIRTFKSNCDFLADWKEKIKARDPDALKQPHDFTVLKSLALSGMKFAGPYAERIMPNLTRAFDFLALRELSVSSLNESRTTFFNYLEALFSSVDRREICLRSLSLQMHGNYYGQDYLETELQLECVYRFIASFDTLVSLQLDEYNKYWGVVETYPGLSTSLQQAILKHRDLETLRFHYDPMGDSGRIIPYVPAITVALLTESLPQLRVLEFPPQETNFHEMAQALSQAKNLKSLTCTPYPSLHDRSQGDTSFTLAKTILEGFLTNTRIIGEFVWEDHYNLTQLAIGWRCNFKVGSALKPGGYFQPAPVTISKGGSTVMCLRLAQESEPDMYLNPDTDWVDKVAKFML
ncbi:hypothetical protein NW762_009116 [Fusarium torreyae]|uniref:F-box domain-containing protein n=1 Tax=Fusarium torreyae TaxID=1237075 RepID=A0A9W8VBX8_9HYPO|nr:hypothetical protein NW762_009116 [Fusarium torreyae]